jgi:protein-S-isoprenylcysteine O-methyltransferase Ste14
MSRISTYGEHSKSLPQKSFLTINHLVAVGLAAWLMLGGGFQTASGWFGVGLHPGSPVRRILLTGCSVIYFGRVCITCFSFLKRSMGWAEASIISIWVYVIHLGFALLGGTNVASLGIVTFVGAVLYGVGSYLNTASEYSRRLWKQRLENRGKLYTRGLFRYSMHVNYFGDEVLFAGFAMVSGSIWAFLVPSLMAVSFVRINIPMLDNYLRDRYGSEFDSYAAKTKKFVPYLY